MKKLYALFAICAMTATATAQTTITEWNFENSTTAPNIGAGDFSYVGGTTANGSTPFVQGNPSSGKALSTTNYPKQNTGSGTAGVQFSVSTVGYANIGMTVDVFGSNTASKFVQMQYSLDGNTWTNAGNPVALQPSTWSTVSYTSSGPANQNSNFIFRIVAVADPTDPSGKYAAIGTTSNYAPTGALRFDNARVTGTATSLAIVEVNGKAANFIKNTVVDNSVVFGAKADVKVYSLTGQLVKAASVNEGTSLDVSALPKGTYIVAGIANGQKVTQKIIKK